MHQIFKPAEKVVTFYQHYMDYVPDDGYLLHHLRDIIEETEELIAPLPEEKLNYRYSKNKWTIKDIIQHLSDCERVITYRATRIARGDKTDLPGFDENLLATNANAGKRSIESLLKEFSLLRTASIFFVSTLDDESLDRTGTANGYEISARLLVNHVYGHHRHHLNIIREKYL